MEELADILSELVAIDTTSTTRKNFDLMAKKLVSIAQRFGLRAEIIRDSHGIPHVLVRLEKDYPEKPTVLFITHYDVVPPGEGWEFDPFKPFVEMGRLYGRGASDDKSAIVAALVAFREVSESAREPSVNPILVIAGGEETGESEDFFRSLSGDLAVILDSGPEMLSIGASGDIRFYIDVLGDQCHSADPIDCKNAIIEAYKLIKYLKHLSKKVSKRIKSKYPTFKYKRLPARLSITAIEGKIIENVIPSKVRIVVDRRTIPEEDVVRVADKFIRQIQKFAKTNKINLRVKHKIISPAWVTTQTDVVLRIRDILSELLEGVEIPIGVDLATTDGVWFVDRMPVVQYGAQREGTNYHGVNEFVYLDDVVLIKNFVKRIMLDLEYHPNE